MNKIEFQGLTIQQQVDYINQGESLSSVCRAIGMSKSIASKYLSKGYIQVNGKYTLTELSNVPPQTQEVAVDTITPPKTKEVKKVQNKPKIGRPCKQFETTKLTLEVNKLLVRKLKHYCIDNEIYMNKFIEDLIRNNLK